jgi:hypothetical protein
MFENHLGRNVLILACQSLLSLALVAVANFSVHAATIVVNAGGDLQSAINAAQPGDTIVLQAGATYYGPFTLPYKAGADYITIQSSAAAQLPEGQRVSPSQSPLFARLVTAITGEPVIKTVPGAHHFKFVGLEMTPASASMLIYSLVVLGSVGAEQDTLEEVPHDLIFDRCYIHGLPGLDTQRGIMLNSAETTVTNSYISAIHGRGYDTQALGGWNGPGPYHIINNYLEGAGENIMFGGAAASIPNLIPSDIEIRRNHIYKPLSWKVGDPSFAGHHWTVKNLLELKNAQRVIIEGNVLENNWPGGQVGIAVQLTPRGENGHNPWATVRDITFSNNIFRNSFGGINMLGRDDSGPSQRQTNITITNNLFDQTGQGPLFQLSGPENVIINHNTAIHQGNIVTAYGAQTTGFIFSNNITQHNHYGIVGDGTPTGNSTINAYFPGSIMERSVLVGAPCNYYPSNNYCPASVSDIGFVSLPGGNYQLSAASPYRNSATDGADVGVDLTVLMNATAGAISGVWGGGSPSPTPIPTPTPTPTSTPTPAPTPTPSPTPGSPPTPPTESIVSFTLVNADTNQDISALTHDGIVDLSTYRNLNVRANTTGGVSSVEFRLNGQLIRTESVQPFALFGDQNGHYGTWTPPIGNHTLLATPNVGSSLAISFMVTEARLNPIDDPQTFVSEHYRDFLNRDPDPQGLAYWTQVISNCPVGDAACLRSKRIDVSAAFFIELEFQETGNFVYRMYKAALGRAPNFSEFVADRAQVVAGSNLEASKQAFAFSWVQRADFLEQYPANLAGAPFIDQLLQNVLQRSGVNLSSHRNALVFDWNTFQSRARIVRLVADAQAFAQAEYNSAFVLMQYFGYLRRDPDAAGYDFWLSVLNNQQANNFQSMVCAFITSAEYQRRFGPSVTRTNAECGQ